MNQKEQAEEAAVLCDMRVDTFVRGQVYEDQRDMCEMRLASMGPTQDWRKFQYQCWARK